jgi:uncharacterized protein YjbJ (UPF0337 family)
MAHYTNITALEMDSFLQNLGFKPVEVEGTKESVYGKIIRPKTCLRVYTGIADGNSREVGKDAIRCTVFTKADGEIKKLGGDKRVHRVEGWRDNLKSRIEDVTEKFSEEVTCPDCGAPMALREAARTKRKFWGCTRYPACVACKSKG